MSGNGDQAPVRLAELVAALSLGIDLGFGQPMEHVLRQCLIGLRLAERLGLSEQQRATVYYTALLINVGCHSDAHEQAKWFGDDIAMKSTKYNYDPHSAKGALAMLAAIGSGNPPLHRVRVGLEFALYGHRDVDGMIAQHSALARRFAAEGLQNRQIAERLGLRANEVHRNMQSLLARLDVRSKLDAIAAAHRSGLIAAHPGDRA